MAVRFTQLVAAPYSWGVNPLQPTQIPMSGTNVYALDSEGRVWWLVVGSAGQLSWAPIDHPGGTTAPST